MCFNSTGCSFMQCRGTNIPVDLSQLQLGSSISGCGAIIAAWLLHAGR